MQPLSSDNLSTPEQAAKILLAGGVGVLPTDTLYGLVARASDKAAVTRLYSLKKRNHKPGTVVAASVEQLVDLGVSRQHIDTVKQWWPNSLSIVLPVDGDHFYLHQGLDSLPIRIPKDQQLTRLLEHTGPLITSSANQPGECPPNNIQEAWAYFGDAIDFYVDGGDLSDRHASTLIVLNNDDTIQVLRHGAFNIPQNMRLKS